MAYTAGLGATPSTTVAFLSPILSVSIGTGQKVLITATQALGSTGGASGLNIYPCHRLSGASSPTTIGAGMFGLTAAAGQRHTFTVSGVVSPAAGTYDVGMCGTGNTSWNNNEWGYVSAIVSN